MDEIKDPAPDESSYEWPPPMRAWDGMPDADTDVDENEAAIPDPALGAEEEADADPA